MIKYFMVQCKFVEVPWESIDNWEEFYMENRYGFHGPFVKVEKEGVFHNLAGRRMDIQDFYPPITLYQRLG